MPLLESLVRASQTAESVSAMENGKTGLRKEAAAARALSSALSVVPEAALGAERPWRLLMDVGASDASATSGNFEMSSVLVAVGGALARVTSVNDARRDELCAAIEQKLKGRLVLEPQGLTSLRAVLGAPPAVSAFCHSAISAMGAPRRVLCEGIVEADGFELRCKGCEWRKARCHTRTAWSCRWLRCSCRRLDISRYRIWQPFKMVGLSLAWRRRRSPGAVMLIIQRRLQCAPFGAT